MLRVLLSQLTPNTGGNCHKILRSYFQFFIIILMVWVRSSYQHSYALLEPVGRPNSSLHAAIQRGAQSRR